MKKFISSIFIITMHLSALEQEQNKEFKKIALDIKQSKTIVHLSNKELEIIIEHFNNDVFKAEIMPRDSTFSFWSTGLPLRDFIKNNATRIIPGYYWLFSTYYNENHMQVNPIGSHLNIKADAHYASLRNRYVFYCLKNFIGLLCCTQTGINYLNALVPLIDNLPEKCIETAQIAGICAAGHYLLNSSLMLAKIVKLKYDLQGGFFVSKDAIEKRKNLFKHIAELKTSWQ